MTQNFTHGGVYALTGPCSMSSPCPGPDAPPERHGATCRHHRQPEAPKAVRTCRRLTCAAPALWRIEGALDNPAPVTWLCSDHVFVPMWDEAPRPYTITISGPHR